MTKRIYPLIVHEGFGAYIGEKKENPNSINSKIKISDEEKIKKIRNSTYTAISSILEEEFFEDENTGDIFKVHFEVTKLQDILKNN